MTRTTAARRGTTLVELLVAAALCILGMWLLTWVYQQGMESFRTSRAQADLTAQQRMVVTLLTRDLKADHFLDEDNKPNRGRRLSDQRTDLLTSNGYTPPRGGYFRAGSLPATLTDVPASYANNFPTSNGFANIFEGSDGINSTRSVNHFLQFTVLLPGGSDSQTFSAEVPPAGGSRFQYFSTAAEVTYYLKFAGQTTGGIPLFDLYRQQRLTVPNDDYVYAYATPALDPSSSEVMTTFAGKMKTFIDLTVPQGYNTSVRLPGPPFAPIPPTSARYGEDKLMTNVLSFEIKFTGAPGISSGVPVANWPTPYLSGNPDYPYDNLPFDGMFDTHSPQLALAPPPSPWNQDIASATNPTRRLKPIRITGMQCRLRTWDSRTKSTRQTTFVVDL